MSNISREDKKIEEMLTKSAIDLYCNAMQKIFEKEDLGRAFYIEDKNFYMNIPANVLTDTPPELIEKRKKFINFLNKNGYFKKEGKLSQLYRLSYNFQDDDYRKLVENVNQFIKKMTIQKIDSTFEVTLHDRIGRFTSVNKDENKDGGIFTGPSYHCESLILFMSILAAVLKLKDIGKKDKQIDIKFKLSKGFFNSESGLLSSLKKCTGKDDISMSDSYDPLDIYDFDLSDLSATTTQGGAKSRRIRRRKHNRKTHHKHVSKTHKRRRHSRSVRKHKKHTSRR
jgi:hypothetical protein